MKLLSHLKIRTKLASMVCLAALTVTAIIAVSAFLSQSRMLEDRGPADADRGRHAATASPNRSRTTSPPAR